MRKDTWVVTTAIGVPVFLPGKLNRQLKEGGTCTMGRNQMGLARYPLGVKVKDITL